MGEAIIFPTLSASPFFSFFPLPLGERERVRGAFCFSLPLIIIFSPSGRSNYFSHSFLLSLFSFFPLPFRHKSCRTDAFLKRGIFFEEVTPSLFKGRWGWILY
ncbi:MAG TPA: hypothetical protein P5150_06745 [Candidatus Ratteibacteria bacterium]|nr:hypothetical protein [Candidatus Ratteibacteria bacterium]